MRKILAVAAASVLAAAACSGDDADSGAVVERIGDTTEQSSELSEASEATSQGTTTDQPATEPSLVGATASEQFPDIVAVDASVDDAGSTWTFSVTVSSPYDTPERYADGWRVVGPDGTVYGVHTLAHDHANEQPFTRVQSGVEIPNDVGEITIEGRDQANGFGGGTVIVNLDELR